MNRKKLLFGDAAKAMLRGRFIAFNDYPKAKY